MKATVSKSQYNFDLLIIIVFLLLITFSLMTVQSGLDMAQAVQHHDLSMVTSLHPFLPLSRTITSLMSLQYLDGIGFYEVIVTIVLLISSLTLEVVASIVFTWLLFYYSFTSSILRRWIQFNLIIISVAYLGFIILFAMTGLKAFSVFFFMTGNALAELAVVQYWYLYGGYGMALYLLISLLCSFSIYRKRPI